VSPVCCVCGHPLEGHIPEMRDMGEHIRGRCCACRKPKALMLEYIMRFYGKRDAMMIGDMESDRLAAEAAGIPFQWAADFFGWETQP